MLARLLDKYRRTKSAMGGALNVSPVGIAHVRENAQGMSAFG
jgi:hypothetical protein